MKANFCTSVYMSSYTENGKSYEEEKRRSYFKAENLLILNAGGSTADSIKATVKRNEDLEKLVRIKNGREIILTTNDLSNLTSKQKAVLLHY